MLIILIVLILILALGGFFYNDGIYRGPGLSLGGVLLILLIILLFTGYVRL